MLYFFNPHYGYLAGEEDAYKDKYHALHNTLLSILEPILYAVLLRLHWASVRF